MLNNHQSCIKLFFPLYILDKKRSCYAWSTLVLSTNRNTTESLSPSHWRSLSWKSWVLIVNIFIFVQYNPILLFFFFLFFLDSFPIYHNVCSDGGVSQCLYKSLYNLYSKMSFFVALSFFSMRRVREHFLAEKKPRQTRTIDNHQHRVLSLSNKSQIRPNN